MKLKTLIFFLASVMIACVSPAQKVKVIIDADTGNEMDDLYAIVKGILDDRMEVQAIVSTHFNNVMLYTDSVWNSYSTKGLNSVKMSYYENERLLKSMGKESIPHYMGCKKMLGFAWGYYPGARIPDSEGTQYIIREAKKASPTEKLNIVCLGAVTNVATALELAPEIAPNIRLYALTMRIDLKTKAWNKNTFNSRNDTNGLNAILDNKDLELIVIPGNVSGTLKFKREETQQRLAAINNETTKILSDRWDDVNAKDEWTMWDLAIIEAIMSPELATMKKMMTPPENVQREISVYTSIDAEKMEASFWEVLTDKMQ